MIRYIATAVAAYMVAFSLNQGMAQGTDDTSALPKATERAKQMPFRGTIVGVDLEAKTVTLGGKVKDRKFVVTERTKIKKEGETVKLEDVRVGDTVGGLARAAGDKWEVVTLNVGEKAEKLPPKEEPRE